MCLQSYPSVLQKVKESVETAVKDYVLPTIVSARNSSTEVSMFLVISVIEIHVGIAFLPIFRVYYSPGNEFSFVVRNWRRGSRRI